VWGFCETPASVSWYDGVAKRPDTDEDNEDAGDVAEGHTIHILLRIQGKLLPWLDDAMDGPLNGHHRQFVSVLGLVRIETFLPSWRGVPGRPPAERAALARAFIAKAVFNPPTTTLLIDMLAADKTPRRLCGRPRAGEVA
jgi:hypothetical protein